MAYMKDKTGRRLDSFEVLDSIEVARGTALPRFVSDNCIATADGNTSYGTSGTSRVHHTIAVDSANLRLVYGNWRNIGSVFDRDGTSTLTIKASIEIDLDNSGAFVIYPLTFGGRTSATIDGGGMAISDPLAIDVPAGTKIYTRTYVSGTAWYSNHYTGALSNNGGWSTSDLVAAGSAAVANTSNSYLFTPMAILGNTTKPSVLVEGDSIAHGFHDAGFGSYMGTAETDADRLASGGGFIARALRSKIGFTNVAVSSDQLLRWILQEGHYRRMSLAHNATHAIIEHGRNDVSNGVAPASLASMLLTSATTNARRGLKVIVTTVCPRSTTTDNWLTVAGQTVETNSANRIAHNQWLRAGAPISPTTKAAVAVGTSGALLAGQSGHPIWQVWDAAAGVESSQDSGKWKGADRIVTDAAITASTTTVTSATANFTSADIGKEILIEGAGAAGAVYRYIRITAVTNATTATVSGGGSQTTVTGARMGIGIYTPDGIHPGPGGARAMASVLATKVDALVA